ncbi:Protein kinase superfamily protein [Striga hermonthica]|uniref:Protein kinase superfamily protein n=1 Tax=Striga hermonthica TaxID=68872 RepID=A0A9N7NUB4_STRHE|nr:Protein kinase superfamily protein [Striga hermonthica]
MSVFLVFTIFCLLYFAVLGVEIDDCKPTRCMKHGPTIRFPFRDKNRSPQHCGYPGFDVLCNESKETVLELPFSVQVAVKKINYVLQQVDLYDPEKCLVKKLPHLNLSTSPLQFLSTEKWDFILVNCSDASRRGLFYSFPCLGDSSSHFLAITESEWDNVGSLDLTSCTRLHKVYVPYNVRNEKYLHLRWSEPACSGCEAKGKWCRLSSKSTSGGHQIQCVHKPNTTRASMGPMVGGAALGSCLFVTILASLVLLYISFRSERQNHIKIEKFLEDYRALKPTRFSYSDITRITRKFSEKLGEGGYGIVYKGRLSNRIDVAVKLLHNSKGNGEEFVNEVSTIGRIHHVNIVRLLGFCAEGSKRALVYEFLPNDSLEKFIFRSAKTSLGWRNLRDITLGIARGIKYLHEGCDQQILHFDIKPHNILLDRNFGPKICDFGLAKLCSKEQSGVTMTIARGTMGYIAPEVLSRTFGRASYKSDVYSFGMMVLEMVGGRKNVDPNVKTSQVFFPQWVYNRLDSEFGEDFWARVEDGENGSIAKRLTIVGLWCIQWSPNDRPSMKEVVVMLEGSEESLVIPPNPFAATDGTSSVAGIIQGRHRHHQIELPSIQESEYFSA